MGEHRDFIDKELAKAKGRLICKKKVREYIDGTNAIEFTHLRVSVRAEHAGAAAEVDYWQGLFNSISAGRGDR